MEGEAGSFGPVTCVYNSETSKRKVKPLWLVQQDFDEEMKIPSTNWVAIYDNALVVLFMLMLMLDLSIGIILV